MTIDAATTSNPFAYLDRALPGSNGPRYVAPEKTADGAPENSSFGDDGFTFDDFLDIINPLQHIPGVATLYRELTGDTINPGARMIGDTIFGGGIGLAMSVINSAVEETTGLDIGANVIAMFSNDDAVTPEPQPASQTMIAALTAGSQEDYTAPAAMIAETAVALVPPSLASPAVVPTVAAAPEMTTPRAAAGPAPEPAMKATPNPGISPAISTTEPAAMTPIGLEWKGPKPNLLKNIKQLEALQTPDLTESQMEAVFKSFRLAPPTPTETPAAAATAAYRKAATVQAPMPARRAPDLFPAR